MESRTPQFDKLLDAVFEELVPHTRTCKWKNYNKHCEEEFEINKRDINFLKMFRVPPPNYCPTCRKMKRMVYMNYVRLTKRKCDAPGHEEMMISILPEECPFPVYDYHYFTSDEFDPLSFGVSYVSGESPMETFFSLRKKFPMPSFLNRDPSSINSDYSNGGKNLKNGYFVFTCHDVENSWYSNVILKSRNIMDSFWVTDSEFTYENIFSDHMYKCIFSYFSGNCTNSSFLFDCRNCSDCFGCVNLRNKNYCVFNEQLSREDYESFINFVYPLSRDKIKEYKNKLWELVKTLPMNGTRNIASINVFGSNIKNCKNLYDVTAGDRSENISHSDEVITARDCMDITFTGDDSSLLYMTVNIAGSSKIKFAVSTKFSNNCEFTYNSRNLNDCFMCFGLQKKSYCILNRQYSKEEYFKILDEIKTEMMKRGEYADGVGMEFCAQAYNFSTGQISFPLNKEEIIKLGSYFAKDPESNAQVSELLDSKSLPQTIEETTDDIIDNAIKCDITGRPFKIVKTELSFYKMMKLPIPNTHPSVRMENRIKLTANGKKYKAVCANCGKDIFSMFDPVEKFILYCEECFKQEIY